MYNVSAALSICPTLSFPCCCAHKSILYVCISIPALQIGSSVIFLNPIRVCVCVCACAHHSVMPDSCNPINCSLPGSSVHGILQARILEWVAFPSPGIKPRSPALQADSLPSELPGKPKNIGVGSHFLLQGIFTTQESNQGLLHFR